MRPSVFRGLDMKAKWKNTYSIKIKTLEFYKFSSLLPVSAGRGAGVVPLGIFGGRAALFSDPDLISNQKMWFFVPVFFHL